MKQLWQQLENHLSAHNPELLADLNPPATDAQIRELEQEIGVQLPADFVCFLKVHNGQVGQAEPLFEGGRFLSIGEIAKESKLWSDLLNAGAFKDFKPEPQSGVAANWWSDLWIPFAANDEGDCICLDLEPAVEGAKGQVIQVWHDSSAREVLAGSFEKFVGDILR